MTQWQCEWKNGLQWRDTTKSLCINVTAHSSAGSGSHAGENAHPFVQAWGYIISPCFYVIGQLYTGIWRVLCRAERTALESQVFKVGLIPPSSRVLVKGGYCTFIRRKNCQEPSWQMTVAPNDAQLQCSILLCCSVRWGVWFVFVFWFCVNGYIFLINLV